MDKMLRLKHKSFRLECVGKFQELHSLYFALHAYTFYTAITFGIIFSLCVKQ